MEIAAGASSEPQHPERAGFGGRRIDWTPRDVFTAVAWVVGAFVAGQILILPLAIAYDVESDEFYAAAFIVSPFVQIAMALIAGAFSFRKYGGGWERLGWARPSGSTFLWAIGALLGALAVSVAYGLFIEAFDIGWLQSECAEQIPDRVRENRGLFALAAFVVIVFPPFCEETFFRGFAFPGFWRRWGLAIAIIAGGLLFSAPHLSYKALIPIAGVGMVFCYVYWRSGNILSTVLAHLAFNSLSIASIAAGACDRENASLFTQVAAVLRGPF